MHGYKYTTPLSPPPFSLSRALASRRLDFPLSSPFVPSLHAASTYRLGRVVVCVLQVVAAGARGDGDLVGVRLDLTRVRVYIWGGGTRGGGKERGREACQQRRAPLFVVTLIDNIYRWMDRWTDGQTHTYICIQTDRVYDGRILGLMLSRSGKSSLRQTDRQTDRHIYTDRVLNRTDPWADAELVGEELVEQRGHVQHHLSPPLPSSFVSFGDDDGGGGGGVWGQGHG